jgi:hypothetical protein
MNHKIISLTALSCATLLFATSCSNVKEQLGLSRRAPDEFAVITRAPLQVPANLNEVTALPLPQRGGTRPQETDPQIAAKQAIGIPVNENDVASNAEQSLISKIGTADPNIRNVVNKEATEAPTNKRPVIKRLLGKGGEDQPAASVVIPSKEKERLKQGATTETPSKDD